MNIVLKKDWDLNIAPPSKEKNTLGHFSGRSDEVSQLTNEILRRNSGAILISGHRGVGKTSLAYKALRSARAQDEKLIVVLINAAQLEVEEDRTLESDKKNDKINPKKIIENLIRRLYSVSRDKDLGANKEIETLYKKAVSKEVERKESFEQTEKQEREIEIESTRKFQVDELDRKSVTTMISWAFAAAYQFGKFNFFGGGVVDSLIPLLLAFPLPYTINYFTKKSEKIKALSKNSEEVAEIYKFDNAIGNLEFDLEGIHSKLADQKRKLIYVIDELDKLTLNQVKEVLKYFKNLFTLSEAVFIFIGGEDIFLIGGTDNLGLREKEYTYFTSRYYLSRPKWKELSEYIDNIVLKKTHISDEDFEIFKRAVCFDAGNDFFDLRAQIRDRINAFSKDDFPEINYQISDSEITKARLHKAITLIYEDRYMYLNPLRWSENENLLRAVFTKAYEVQKSYYGFEISDPRGSDLNQQIIRDFYKLLNRLEVLTVSSEIFDTINKVNVPIRTYSVVSKIPQKPPLKYSDPTEYEKQYIYEFDNYVEILLQLSNIVTHLKHEYSVTAEEFFENPNKVFDNLNDLGVNFREIFDTQKKIYTNVTRQIYPYPYQKETLDENTKQIKQFCNNLLNNQLRLVFPRLLKSVIRGENLEIVNLNNNPQIFSGVASPIKKSLLDNRIKNEVLIKTDFSRQMLFVSDNVDIVAENKDILREISQTHQIVYFSRDNKIWKLSGLYTIHAYDVNSLKEAVSNYLAFSIDFFKNDD